MSYIVDTSTNTVTFNGLPLQSGGGGATGPTGPTGPASNVIGPTGPTGPTPDTSVFLTQSSASSTYATQVQLSTIDVDNLADTFLTMGG